jgi:tetratricopeptide (TPR) repeat protein
LIIFKNENNYTAFAIYFILYIFYNAVLGFIIYKPKIEFKNHRVLSILTGILISYNLTYIFWKIVTPEYKIKYFSISIVFLILFQITILLIHLFRNSLNTTFKINYISNAFIKICVLILISVVLWFSNPYIIANFMYKKDSYDYRLFEYEINYNNIQRIINENLLDSAMVLTNNEIDKLKQINDFTSYRLQQLLSTKGYIYFSKKNIHKADSLNNLILEIYSGYDKNSINKTFNSDYRNCFYLANFNSALINMGIGRYEKADSLFQITLNHYTKKNKKSEILFYQANIAFNLGNLAKADSLLNLSLEFIPIRQLSSKRHLLTIVRLAYLKKHYNDISATEYLLNGALYLFDKNIKQYNIHELSITEKFQRLKEISNEM